MHPPRLAALALLATTAPLTSCAALTDALANGVKAPTSGLNRVDLVESPSLNKLLNFSCHNYLGASSSACQLAGWNSPPRKSDLRFSFDIVFDLYNPNAQLPIPLVELLLGFTVFSDQNLGAVCVSFCDPDAEDCASAGQNLQGACEIDDNTTEVDEASDLVPSVDDLMDLATDLSNGTADNWEFRVIPSAATGDCQPAGSECVEESGADGAPQMCCDGECTPMEHDECTVTDQNDGRTCADCDGHTEAHIAFDFNIDTMLGLFENLLVNAVEDAISGRNVSLAIPYSADGTLFFDAPNLGRYAAGFGPMDDTWNIR